MNDYTANIEIQNTLGRFAQYYTAKCFNKISSELFSKSDDARYDAPEDGALCEGFAQIEAYFSSLQEKNAGDEIVMTHTHAIRIAEDGKSAELTCMTYCFKTWPADTVLTTAEYGSKRMDAKLVWEDGAWKFKTLHYYYFISMVPETYDAAARALPCSIGWKQITVPERTAATNPQDYVEIRQVQNRWCQNKRADGMDLFSKGEEVTFSHPLLGERTYTGQQQLLEALQELDTLEAKNESKYIDIPMTTSGVIEVEPDGKTAKGTWLVVTNCILGAAFGHPEFYCPNLCRLGWFEQTFVKEKGKWKILRFDLKYLFTLPENTYDRESSRMTPINRQGDNWQRPPEVSGFTEKYFADVLEIEQLICHWTYSLRNRSFARFYYDFYARERKDLLEEGFERTGKMFGLTDSFTFEQPKYAGLHTGTTPYVEVSEDGEYATAVWLDYGFTSFGEKFGFTENPFYANASVARYEFKCVKCDGKWKMCRMQWQPFYRIRYLAKFWRFDYRTTKGWAGSDTTKRFPLPFGNYEYVEKRREWDKPFQLDPPEISTPFEKQVGLIVGD